jgi:homoserine kinase type II
MFRDGQIVLVADFDFMGERVRIDDLALTLYYTNPTFTEDQTSDVRLHQLLTLINAYDAGLDRLLTTAERASLPTAMSRAPLAFIAMIAALDSDAGVHEMATGMRDDIAWASAIASNLTHWQSAFTA